jgi:hypothetical protein
MADDDNKMRLKFTQVLMMLEVNDMSSWNFNNFQTYQYEIVIMGIEKTFKYIDSQVSTIRGQYIANNGFRQISRKLI